MKKLLVILLCLGQARAFAAGSGEKPVVSNGNGAAAQAAGETALREKAEALAAQMSGELRVKSLFDGTFFRYNSLTKTVELLSRLNREYGRVAAVVTEAVDTPDSARFTFETEKGFMLPLALSLNRETGLISGMFFKTPGRKNLSLASIREQFAALPGSAGFLAVKLNPPGAVLEALHSNEPFPITSLSKLYLLGAVQEEGYSWKKVVVLKENLRSFPPGRMRDWPDGSPATLHTLAMGMIVENDNTAADAVADTLGRAKLEQLLPALGHSDPESMKPFLRTAEVFRLKSDTESTLQYINASRSERYWLLGRIAGEPLSAGDYKPGPFAMDRIGWRASPGDLCRLMDRFRKSEDKTAREILGVNTGVEIPRNRFDYAGYKGGAEPGALSGVWLLMKNNEDWYCLAGAWNSWNAVLDEKKFYGLMQSAVYAIGGQE